MKSAIEHLTDKIRAIANDQDTVRAEAFDEFNNQRLVKSIMEGDGYYYTVNFNVAFFQRIGKAFKPYDKKGKPLKSWRNNV